MQLAKQGPESQTRLFLPAFYACLHPRGIPHVNQLDTALTPDEPVLHPIANALCSLEYIFLLETVPTDSILHLWNRAWKWIQFLHDYATYLPPLRSEPALYTIFSLVIGKLTKNEEAAETIYQTIGLRVVLARAWRLLLPEAEGRSQNAMQAACGFLFCPFPALGMHGIYLEESFEGAGGTPSHLASLMLTHLNGYANGPVHSPLPLFFLSAIISFVAIYNGKHDAFQDALLAHGSVTTYTHIACAISEGRISGPTTEYMATQVWNYLDMEFKRPPAYPAIKEAIGAGLLSTIIVSATLSNVATSVASVVDMLLPHTVYYSVLSGLEPALREVADLQNTQAFVQSDVFNKWGEFWDLAQERITVMKHYESDAYVSSKACDSLEVSLLLTRMIPHPYLS